VARIVAVPSPEAAPAAIAEAAVLIRSGQLVAFPTETVYGLGADALDPAAVDRIYQAKGRPAYNPVIVHVADAGQARELAARWPSVADRLADRWWPGPLTLVVPKAIGMPDAVTAGLPNVALRVPAHPVALALLKAAGRPIAAPSANRSGQVSPTTAAHVAEGLGDAIGLILDGGPTTIGIESTVLDLSGPRPVILRPGMVTRPELEAVVGPIEDPVRALSGEDGRPSPGMLDRHYAPRVPLVVAGPGGESLRETVARLTMAGAKVGALVRGFDLHPGAVCRALPQEPAGYARELYQAIHELDGAGVSVIVAEELPDHPAWEGIRDRLRRAATPAAQGEPAGP
jgi:L-threonylcarbamoyladenylate synthase